MPRPMRKTVRDHESWWSFMTCLLALSPRLAGAGTVPVSPVYPCDAPYRRCGEPPHPVWHHWDDDGMEALIDLCFGRPAGRPGRHRPRARRLCPLAPAGPIPAGFLCYIGPRIVSRKPPTEGDVHPRVHRRQSRRPALLGPEG